MEGFKKFGGIDGLIKRRVGSKSLVKCQSREVKFAHYVIDNSRTLEETRRQVEALYRELKALAQG
ncbi:MAG: hypothetical protein DRI92_06290 [Aquificota bacterium]|nr:MAG: hypothetical protein DRI92_06290 [Aquificota bacterium]